MTRDPPAVPPSWLEERPHVRQAPSSPEKLSRPQKRRRRLQRAAAAAARGHTSLPGAFAVSDSFARLEAKVDRLLAEDRSSGVSVQPSALRADAPVFCPGFGLPLDDELLRCDVPPAPGCWLDRLSPVAPQEVPEVLCGSPGGGGSPCDLPASLSPRVEPVPSGRGVCSASDRSGRGADRSSSGSGSLDGLAHGREDGHGDAGDLRDVAKDGCGDEIGDGSHESSATDAKIYSQSEVVEVLRKHIKELKAELGADYERRLAEKDRQLAVQRADYEKRLEELRADLARTAWGRDVGKDDKGASEESAGDDELVCAVCGDEVSEGEGGKDLEYYFDLLSEDLYDERFRKAMTELLLATDAEGACGPVPLEDVDGEGERQVLPGYACYGGCGVRDHLACIETEPRMWTSDGLRYGSRWIISGPGWFCPLCASPSA
eukprot:CAMPEP_0204532044 /NCGR_PEP_ID=MMETSP0661-20131031/11509_1 /ASSEMBLY_ACC=CAM_ASM_000606 /TAXON_ID=109239 /ORGANISM="Alexandrium margalefi, Strain AMGDE01CS-322" /LENGTH=431 /DNA_ID=CAMNT_0051538249 /DNA_START=138 /DNA_END=1433 /DNA_ORIENTATION=+